MHGKKKQALSVAVLTCGLLVACGGGGSSSAPPTETVAPTVSAVAPINNSTLNSAGIAITVTFSEAIDCASVASDTISLREQTAPIAGATMCSGSTLTFNATSGIPTSSTITASISTAVKDLAGNHLATQYGWSFGTAPWTLQFGTPTTDASSALAIDATGNLYVAGNSNGTLGGNTDAGGFDAVLVKYNSLGVKQWSRQFGTTASDSAYAVIADGSGNLYVGGVTDGTLAGSLPATGTDGFVAKYNSSGAQLWIRQLSSTGTDFVRALATDGGGNVIVVGYTSGDLYNMNAGGASDLFVVKFNGTGTLLWSSQIGTASTDNAAGVAVDPAGNVYVTGYTFGDLDGNASAGSSDIFLIKYDSSGVKQWSRQLGSAGLDVATGIAIDGTGNLFVAGRTDGSLDGSANAGGLDAFVAKFDSSGAKKWTRQFGSASDDYAYSVAIDADGNAVVAGHTLGAMSGVTSAGGADAFLAKFDALGTTLWTRQVGTIANDYAVGVRVDSAGNAFVAGHTEGALDGNASAGGPDMFVVKYQSDGRKR